MTAFEEVVAYLVDKVGRTSPTHPNANTGAQLLLNHSTFLQEPERYVDAAIHTLQVMFTIEAPNNEAGTAPLTNASIKIGKKVWKIMDIDPYPVRDTLRLGDLFVEALYNSNCINLYYPERPDSSHTISAEPKWAELADISFTERAHLYATVFDRPADIKGPTQKIKGEDYRIIKRRDNVDTTADYTKAANKLQQTGWRINRRVLDSMVSLREHFISDMYLKRMKIRSRSVGLKLWSGDT